MNNRMNTNCRVFSRGARPARRAGMTGFRISDFGFRILARSVGGGYARLCRIMARIHRRFDAKNQSTPKGFRSHSPGLPGLPGYPGIDTEMHVNPERVVPVGEPPLPTELNAFRDRVWEWNVTQGYPTNVGQPRAVLRNAFSVTLRGARPARRAGSVCLALSRRHTGTAPATRSPLQGRNRAGRAPRLDKIETALVRMQHRIRRGSTLTEVLIALLIMSIGLVALAVLFPMSVLRSIKASQLTNATDARYNAEAAIDQFPMIVRDPDFWKDATGKIDIHHHDGEFYIFDPLGYAIIQGEAAGLQNNFGNKAGTAFGLTRYAGTWGSKISDADALVTLPDSWVLQHEGIGTGITATTVSLGASLFNIPAAPVTRAVIFTGDGSASQARPLIANASASDTVSWTDALPTSLTTNASGIGKVRIEMQERRYTWLLTVRKDFAGGASVDVVVFFQRRFDPAIDEALYAANFVAGSTVVNSVTFPANGKLKTGTYVFDAINAFWYRIANVNQAAGTITLDVPANLSSPAGGGVAMYPRNVVDVYPIGAK